LNYDEWVFTLTDGTTVSKFIINNGSTGGTVYTITYDFSEYHFPSDMVLSNEQTVIEAGSNYNSMITLLPGATIPVITVIMGGNIIIDSQLSSADGYEISINNVSGDIIIKFEESSLVVSPF
jgi:hypothetical protein